jgi:hypothetical protein
MFKAYYKNIKRLLSTKNSILSAIEGKSEEVYNIDYLKKPLLTNLEPEKLIDVLSSIKNKKDLDLFHDRLSRIPRYIETEYIIKAVELSEDIVRNRTLSDSRLSIFQEKNRQKWMIILVVLVIVFFLRRNLFPNSVFIEDIDLLFATIFGYALAKIN